MGVLVDLRPGVTERRAVDSVCWGLLMAWLGADALGLFGGVSAEHTDVLERRRLQNLRNHPMYDRFESWIAPVARYLQVNWSTAMDRLDHQSAILLIADWKFADRLALWSMQGLILAVGWLFVWMLVGGELSFSAVMGAAAILGLAVFWQVTEFLALVNSTRRQVRARLPLALELMALIMESGGGEILSSWELVTNENRGHPLGEHLQLVLDRMRRGMTFPEALQSWADLSREDDVAEVVLMLRTAKMRGSPIQENLRILADQARLRRIQRLDRAAESARVHITWPGFVMMLACLLIACAPLTLMAWRVFESL